MAGACGQVRSLLLGPEQNKEKGKSLRRSPGDLKTSYLVPSLKGTLHPLTLCPAA